jgi:hypothetical protein
VVLAVGVVLGALDEEEHAVLAAHPVKHQQAAEDEPVQGADAHDADYVFLEDELDVFVEGEGAVLDAETFAENAVENAKLHLGYV